jgi:hypothetical protein
MIGMAGSGKTTLMQVKVYKFKFNLSDDLNEFFSATKRSFTHEETTSLHNKLGSSRCVDSSLSSKYITLLLVRSLPYGANIDIRDTVKYKDIMKQ